LASDDFRRLLSAQQKVGRFMTSGAVLAAARRTIMCRHFGLQFFLQAGRQVECTVVRCLLGLFTLREEYVRLCNCHLIPSKMNDDIRSQHICARLRDLLNERSVKLWLSPYCKEGKCDETKIEVSTPIVYSAF